MFGVEKEGLLQLTIFSDWDKSFIQRLNSTLEVHNYHYTLLKSWSADAKRAITEFRFIATETKHLKANRKITFNKPAKKTSDLIWYIIRIKYPARQQGLNYLNQDQLKRYQQSHHKREPSNSKIPTNRTLSSGFPHCNGWILDIVIVSHGLSAKFLPFKNLGKKVCNSILPYIQKNHSLVRVNKMKKKINLDMELVSFTRPNGDNWQSQPSE